jgi:hypothetical protein
LALDGRPPWIGSPAALVPTDGSNLPTCIASSRRRQHHRLGAGPSGCVRPRDAARHLTGTRKAWATTSRPSISNGMTAPDRRSLDPIFRGCEAGPLKFKSTNAVNSSSEEAPGSRAFVRYYSATLRLQALAKLARPIAFRRCKSGPMGHGHRALAQAHFRSASSRPSGGCWCDCAALVADRRGPRFASIPPDAYQRLLPPRPPTARSLEFSVARSSSQQTSSVLDAPRTPHWKLWPAAMQGSPCVRSVILVTPPPGTPPRDDHLVITARTTWRRSAFQTARNARPRRWFAHSRDAARTNARADGPPVPRSPRPASGSWPVRSTGNRGHHPARRRCRGPRRRRRKVRVHRS